MKTTEDTQPDLGPDSPAADGQEPKEERRSHNSGRSVAAGTHGIGIYPAITSVLGGLFQNPKLIRGGTYPVKTQT